MIKHSRFSTISNKMVTGMSTGTFALFAIVMFFYPLVARAVEPYVSFGGIISSIALPNLTLAGIPNPACPIYSLVTNANPTNGFPAEFGVFTPPLIPAPSYDNNNLFIPSTPILGGLLTIPCVGGTAPVPIFPIFLNGLFYLDGTGSLPGM